MNDAAIVRASHPGIVTEVRRTTTGYAVYIRGRDRGGAVINVLFVHTATVKPGQTVREGDGVGAYYTGNETEPKGE